MRTYHERVFEDSVEGTTAVYTNPALNSLLAMTERVVITVYATQTSGTTPTLTIRTQDSGDDRTWKTNQASPEINSAALSTTAQTSLLAQSTATGPISGFRRLEITLGGTSPKSHLCIYVTGRSEHASSAPVGRSATGRAAMRSGDSDLCSRVQKCC